MTRCGLVVFVLMAAACGGAVNDQGNGIGGGANAGGAGGGAGAAAGASAGSVAGGASNDAAPPKICSPGQEIGCYCGGGVDGLQFCNGDGTAYGSCQGCVAPPVWVGGYAGMGGAGGSGGWRALGGAAGVADADETPSEIPSRQTVTFNLHNGTTEKWVVTKGTNCAPFAIGGVDLVPAYDYCLCESPGPPPVGATYLTHVAPGETLAITWDARQVVKWSTPFDCATRGWPGIVSTQVHYVMQPVAAGSYRATFGYELAPAIMSSCLAAGPDYSCWPGSFGYTGLDGICHSTKTVAQDFTLSADGGGVSVEVNLD